MVYIEYPGGYTEITWLIFCNMASRGLPSGKSCSKSVFFIVLTVLIIAGTTAVGKTDLSLQLATLLGGEIVSADSVQVRGRYLIN